MNETKPRKTRRGNTNSKVGSLGKNKQKTNPPPPQKTKKQNKTDKPLDRMTRKIRRVGTNYQNQK